MLPGALVAQALEQFLAGSNGAAPALSSDSGKLELRLAALEERVAHLERKPPAPPPAKPARPSTKPPAIPPSGDALTTVQLAARLGMKSGSLNERIRRAGGAAPGMEMEGWRIIGQAKLPQGGPPQWLWEATSAP